MTNGATSRPPYPRRAGFALVLVLCFAAIVAITGMAMLNANSTLMPQAQNLRSVAQAKSLAASGVALASHYLRVPPSTVTVGNYWTGVTGLSIDGSINTVDVAVTRSSTMPENFLVTALGVVRDPDGSIRGRSTASTEIVTPPPMTWTLRKAVTSGGDLDVPSKVQIDGDLHANGKLTGSGTCTGNLTANSSIGWTGTPAPASITQNVAAVAMPAMNTSEWNRYVVNGVVRAAQAYSSSSFSAAGVASTGGTLTRSVVYKSDGTVAVLDTTGGLGDTSLLGSTVGAVGSLLGLSGATRTGASVLSGNNPGGVLVASGGLTMALDATFIGTLVVNGDLRITTVGASAFCAMPGYPALVVTGKIRVDLTTNLEIRGPALCGDDVRGDLTTLMHYGPLLLYGYGFQSNLGLTGSARFHWDTNYASLFDFSTSVVQPMTLVKWSE